MVRRSVGFSQILRGFRFGICALYSRPVRADKRRVPSREGRQVSLKIVQRDGDYVVTPTAVSCVGLALLGAKLPQHIRLVYEDGTLLLLALSDDALKELYQCLRPLFDKE